MKIRIRTTSGPRGATLYNGKSVHDLARELQCDPSHVSRILNARAYGSWRFMARLAAALEVGLDSLLMFRLLRPTAAAPIAMPTTEGLEELNDAESEAGHVGTQTKK